MKIAYSHYELNRIAKSSRVPRQGVLLRIEENGCVGYADLHPWPELGDLSLAEQLHFLREGRLTALAKSSLRFAKLDARARSQGVSVFQGLVIPESHFLVTDLASFDASMIQEIHKGGFRRVKIKVGSQPLFETQRLTQIVEELPPEVLIRLDFNATLSWKELQDWLERGEKFLRRIDFLEDPVQWNPVHWKSIRNDWGLRVAADREGVGSDADLRVIKPALSGAVLDEQEFSQEVIPWVVTSYLDHPLGQLTAAYEAARSLKSGIPMEICGLLSHRVYEKTVFSEQLRSEGAQLLPSEGVGFGLDRLLESLVWEPLS